MQDMQVIQVMGKIKVILVIYKLIVKKVRIMVRRDCILYFLLFEECNLYVPLSLINLFGDFPQMFVFPS